MLHKTISGIELKADGGTIQGYASTFNVTDRQGEVVLTGAFAESIKAFRAGQKIPLLDAHRVFGSTEAVIGRIVELEEDSIGLKFRAELSGTALAQDVRKKIREGLLDSLSIGYSVELDGMRGKVRLLKRLKLHEISVVIFPANPDARITGVKGAEGLAMTSKARVAQLEQTARDLDYIEERLEELSRKGRMVEALEQMTKGERLTPEQLGYTV